MLEPRFRLWGIPIRVHASFAFVALAGLTSGSLPIAGIWVLVVFFTTLVHELGHAVAFLAFGRQPSIVLFGLGGLTHGDGPPLGRGKDVVMSLAGPLTEMLLIGVPALYLVRRVDPASDTLAITLDLLVWVGIGWALLNLLPVLPLDGGRVAAGILEGVWGLSGARAARWFSIAVALAGTAFAAAKGFFFGAAFGLFFVAQNRNDLHRLRDAPAADLLAKGHEVLDQGDSSEAERIANDVSSSARSAPMTGAALHLLAWAHLVAGRRAEAAAALARLPDDVRPSRAILAYTLLLDGNPDDAVETAVGGMLEDVTGVPPNGQLAIVLEREGLLDDVVDRLLRDPGSAGPRAVHVLSGYLHRTGRYAAAAALCEKLFGDDRSNRGMNAYNAACALARLGRSEEALVWLDRAVELGFADATFLDGDEDLASLRDHEGFLRIRARV